MMSLPQDWLLPQAGREGAGNGEEDVGGVTPYLALVAQALFLFPWLDPAPPGLLATALGFHDFGRETGIC